MISIIQLVGEQPGAELLSIGNDTSWNIINRIMDKEVLYFLLPRNINAYKTIFDGTFQWKVYD